MRFDDVEALLEDMERPMPSAALMARIEMDAEVVRRERALPRRENQGWLEGFAARVRGLFTSRGYVLPGISGGLAAASLAVLMVGSQPQSDLLDMDAMDVAYIEGYLLDWPLDGEPTSEEVALFDPIWDEMD